MAEKKIAVVAPAGIDLNDEKFRQIIGEVFVKNAEKLKEPDTSLDFFLTKKGFQDFGAFSWASLNVWNHYELYETILGVKGRGYDGVLVHCFGDPHLYALRQRMDIPVVGVFENALYFAKMMGKKIGLVTFSKYIVPVYENIIAGYGCKDWVVSIKSTESSGNDFMESLVNAKRLIETFSAKARECIAEGAEVLIPACTILAPVIRMAPGCQADYPDGLNEVDEVPIVDVISTALRMTEVLASMKQFGMPWISRACTFNSPPEDILKNTEAAFPYHGSGEQKY